MLVIGGLPCRRERRLVYAVARHGNGTVGLNAGARAPCRLPRSRDVTNRSRPRSLSAGERVLDRIPPPVNHRQICRGACEASAAIAACAAWLCALPRPCQAAVLGLPEPVQQLKPVRPPPVSGAIASLESALSQKSLLIPNCMMRGALPTAAS